MTEMWTPEAMNYISIIEWAVKWVERYGVLASFTVELVFLNYGGVILVLFF